MEPWVAIEKLMNRKHCQTCGGNYNTAHIVRDGYDMPAILPDAKTNCKRFSGENPNKCWANLKSRSDDTAEIIANRMIEYTEKTSPVCDYYEKKGQLHVFHVHKGVKDTPELLNLMLTS